MIINNKRALAYIAKINSITPLEGYDRVEYAHIGGWGVVVSKNDNFQPGGLCIYIETDSLVPNDDERFAFMAKRNYKVKIQKMCKVYSQGLIMPLSSFPEIKNPKENEDVTDILGITYYVKEDNQRKSDGNSKPNYKSLGAKHPKLFKTKPIRWLMRREWGRKLLNKIFSGKKKTDTSRRFPTHFPYISKTDEERIENLPHLIGYKNPLVVTEKLDGTSSTYILERVGNNRLHPKLQKFEFYVCSRNVRMKDEKQETYFTKSNVDEKNIYWNNAFKYNIREHLEQYLNDYPELQYVCIQGESVGTSIQGNPLKLESQDLYVFNFIRSDIGRINSVFARDIVEGWGMKWVPILDTNYIMPDDMETFKLYADGKSEVNPKVNREGVVLRDPTCNLSFKNVSRKYLEKHN